MRKNIVSILALSALLSGCGDEEPPAAPEKIALKCGNYDVAIEIIDEDVLHTAINGEKITMNRAISASGAKYDGEGAAVSASVWNKGPNWMLIIDNGRGISCKPAAAGKRK